MQLCTRHMGRGGRMGRVGCAPTPTGWANWAGPRPCLPMVRSSRPSSRKACNRMQTTLQPYVSQPVALTSLLWS